MKCLDTLASFKHEIVVIFGTQNGDACPNLTAYALNKNIQYINQKPKLALIEDFISLGVNCFFSVEYEYLIPLPQANILSLNIHPSLLPEGRGKTPLSHIILNYPQYAGVTFHKLAASFDKGDILMQQAIFLDNEETLDSLLNKTELTTIKMLTKLLANFDSYYNKAKPQGRGSYWPALTLQDRLLNWQDDAEKISRMSRAFGRFGVLACVKDEIWLLNHLQITNTNHLYLAGQLIEEDDYICSIAIKNAIVTLYKNSILEKKRLTDL